MSRLCFAALLLLTSEALAETPEVPAQPPVAPAQLPVAPAQPPAASRVIGLSEALTKARANHPLLRQAAAATDLAEARTDSARAPLLPQITATAAYQRTTANAVFRPGFSPNANVQYPDPNSTTYNFYNFGVNASQLLYDFGGSIETFRAARDNAKAQAVSQRTSELSVDYNVRSAFFTARASRSAVAVARENLQNQARHLAQIQALVEVGIRPEIDLAQVRTDVANARVQLINAENAYDTARATLNQAMGVVGPIDYDVPDSTLEALPEEDASIEALFASAVTGRPDLRALGLQVDAQSRSIRSTKAQFGPGLFATGAFTDAGKELNNLRWNWNVGLSLNWALYQGGITQGNLRQARATLESLRAQADVVRQTVLLQLQQGRLAIRAARASLDAAGEAATNARVRLNLAEGRYEAGAGSIIELGDAQVALTLAESQHVQAEYNLAIARAQLLNALGRTE